ncbi:MAG TPA: acetyl-CoA C-acetyltransferase [Actinopolymorphaceae bacterium]
MTEAYIFDAVRTPRGRGKPSGALHGVRPVRLATTVLQAIARRNDLDPAVVDDVLLGIVTATGEQGADLARLAVLEAGWAESVPGVQLNRFCASGLEAVDLAAQQVRAGFADLVVAGGVESMSRVPMGSDGGDWFLDPATSGYVPQGISADLLATLDGITREETDAYAVRSHRRAAAAWSRGFFEKSIIPVYDDDGRLLLDHDEGVRPDTSLEVLAALPPAFASLGEQGLDAVALRRYPEVDHVEHVHTAGSSSQIVDGAAAVLVGSAEAGRRYGLEPRARIVSVATIGTEPTLMLGGPAPATVKALERLGLGPADVDLFEVNEAFAAVVLRFVRALGVAEDKVNVHGGAIAMGHPLGATGAMLVGILTDELERRGARRGVVTLCAGGGMGIATVLEAP